LQSRIRKNQAKTAYSDQIMLIKLNFADDGNGGLWSFQHTSSKPVVFMLFPMGSFRYQSFS